MVRNLKDTLVSLHNFCGVAINGMLGNNLGPGSFERFVNVNGCPNAMGSALVIRAARTRLCGGGTCCEQLPGAGAAHGCQGPINQRGVRPREDAGHAGFWMQDNCRKGGVGGVEGRRGAERQGALVKVQQHLQSGAGVAEIVQLDPCYPALYYKFYWVLYLNLFSKDKECSKLTFIIKSIQVLIGDRTF